MSQLVPPEAGSALLPLPFGEASVGALERIIEYPWVLNRVTKYASVLDVGVVSPPVMSGYDAYVFNLTRVLGCRRVTLDLMPGADIRADIARVKLAPKSFDYVIAISTLEHVHKPVEALENMARIGNEVLVTMPFGFDHSMSWGHQYDRESLVALLSGCTIVEEEYFKYENGWHPSTWEELADRPYHAFGAPGAAGIVCLKVRQ